MGKVFSGLCDSVEARRDSVKSKDDSETDNVIPEIRVISDEEFQKMRFNYRKRSIQDLLQENYNDGPLSPSPSPSFSRARKWSINLLRRLSGSSNEDIPNFMRRLSNYETQKTQSPAAIPEIVVDTTTFTRKNTRRRVIRRNDGFRKAFRTNNTALKEARDAVQSSCRGYDSE